MFEADINFVAVAVATLSAMFVGYFWYGPLLFGKAWMRLVDKTHAQIQQGGGNMYLGALLSHLIMAVVLAHFIDYVGSSSFLEGMQLGAWTWLGFIATSHSLTSLFQGKSKDLLIIDLGYHLVNMIVIGGILAVWA